MNKRWKLLSALLATFLLFTALPIVPHASEPPIRLLAIYGSDMLFQQNEPVRLAGFAPQGTALHAELTRSYIRAQRCLPRQMALRVCRACSSLNCPASPAHMTNIALY
ncbi:MAG: hypothetical protein FWC27_10215 [Firmicutes bacterium]|nr:hypothetical protein [Bacillota bacterium]